MFLYLLKCPKVHTICIFCILCILFPGIDCVYGKLYYTYMHWYSCLFFGAPFPPTEHDSRIIDKVGWSAIVLVFAWRNHSNLLVQLHFGRRTISVSTLRGRGGAQLCECR